MRFRLLWVSPPLHWQVTGSSIATKGLYTRKMNFMSYNVDIVRLFLTKIGSILFLLEGIMRQRLTVWVRNSFPCSKTFYDDVQKADINSCFWSHWYLQLADKFVGLVPSEPTSLCYILQNKFVGLVLIQPTNLSAGSWRFLFKELG
jgi:hypothetical protein